jgi:predicted F0F1-ATPase subunit
MTKTKRSWLQDLGQEAARATTLGWELAAPIFGGVLLGHFLDTHLDTGYTFTLGLLFAGVAAGFYNIWRFAQRMSARQQAEKAKRDQENRPE